MKLSEMTSYFWTEDGYDDFRTNNQNTGRKNAFAAFRPETEDGKRREWKFLKSLSDEQFESLHTLTRNGIVLDETDVEYAAR